MLRIAVPNKGMLSEPAWNMLAEAGYRLRTNPRQLVVQDEDNGIELFYLRPLDIAVYVGRGAIDVGITGQDLLKNSRYRRTRAHAARLWSPPHSASRLRTNPRSPLWKTFRASAWPPPSISWCMTTRRTRYRSRNHPPGRCGGVLRAAGRGRPYRRRGLHRYHPAQRRSACLPTPLMHSEACLIRSPRLDEGLPSRRAHRRLQGVLTAHQYVLMDYDIP